MSFPYPFPLQFKRGTAHPSTEAPDPGPPPLPTVILPSFPEPRYDYTVTLSGEVYGIEITTNRRDGHRYFSLSRNSEPVLSGVRIVPGWPIRRSASEDMPPGDFVPLDEATIAYVEAPE